MMDIKSKNLLDRPRRLRQNVTLRKMVSENHFHLDDFIYPMFVIDGNKIKNEIPSMPGIYQWSIDMIVSEIDTIINMGISKILLFGVPENKDEQGSVTWLDDGIIQKAVRKLKHEFPELYIISDICFCGYTDHGHCGVLQDGDLHNDMTLSNVSKQVLSHVSAGVDMVAPSLMIDGMVGEIRSTLDKNGFSQIPIMSYSVKYASSFYGPFRDAVDSSPKIGDSKTYQMDPANRREALKEVELDLMEGADIIMVKPALSYLDIIRDIKQICNVPIACYNVSGEYSMVKASANKGWLDHDEVMMEMLLSMKRAGADIIISYFAKDIAKILRDSHGIR